MKRVIPTVQLRYTIPKTVEYRGERYKYFGKFNLKSQAEAAGAKKNRKVVVATILEDGRTKYLAFWRKK